MKFNEVQFFVSSDFSQEFPFPYNPVKYELGPINWAEGTIHASYNIAPFLLRNENDFSKSKNNMHFGLG